MASRCALERKTTGSGLAVCGAKLSHSTELLELLSELLSPSLFCPPPVAGPSVGIEAWVSELPRREIPFLPWS